MIPTRASCGAWMLLICVLEALSPVVHAFVATRPTGPSSSSLRAMKNATPDKRPSNALPVPAVLEVGFPERLSSSLITDLEQHGIFVFPNYASPEVIDLLRFDALRMKQDGFCQTAKTEHQKKTPKRENRGEEDPNKAEPLTKPPPRKRIPRHCEQTWLWHSSGSLEEKADDVEDIRRGVTPQHMLPLQDRRRRKRYSTAPRYVGDFISTLEEELEGVSPYHRDRDEQGDGTNAAADSIYFANESSSQDNPIHIHETEAAYLYYEEGGYYDDHIDTGDRRKPTTPSREENLRKNQHRRAFSFLLYLGGDEQNRNEWKRQDGGCLRVYSPLKYQSQKRRINSTPPTEQQEHSKELGTPSSTNKGAVYLDILPEEGTLVIFKSEVIPHEVRETKRGRMALVGWLHGDLD